MTIISQLITDARSRFGAFSVLEMEVSASMLDNLMDQVIALGGQVSLDSCIVEGLTVRELPEEGMIPRVLLVDETVHRDLVPLAED